MRALIKIFGIIAALSAAISCSPSSKTAKAAADGSFRLLYWNIQNGMWSGQQDGHEKFVNWIKEQDPDVCVWCEGQANYVTNSVENLPDDPDKYLYGFWKEMSGRYGHKFVAFSGRRDRFAQVVTSKYPIRTVAQLVGEEPDSVVTHGSGWFAVELGGKTINLVTLHTWPQPWAFRCEDREASAKVREGDDYRRMEIQYICEHTIGKVPDASSQYWMMMGDFNSRSRRDNYVYGYPDRDTRFLVQDYIYGHTRIHIRLRSVTLRIFPTSGILRTTDRSSWISTSADRLLIQVFRNGFVDLSASEAALQDFAVRAEQDDVRNGVDVVQFDRNPLSIKYLVPRKPKLGKGFQGVLPFVVQGYSHHVELLAGESFPDFPDVRHLSLARPAPGSPVVHQNVLAPAYIIRKPYVGSVRIPALDQIVLELLARGRARLLLDILEIILYEWIFLHLLRHGSVEFHET